MTTEVMDAVAATAQRLGASTLRHWPTKLWSDDHRTPYTEIPEATTLQYLAFYLLERGFDTFAEVPLHLEGGNGRVDLVAVREAGSGHDVLAVEAKRLFSAEGAVALATDWDRLTTTLWAEGVTIPQRTDPAVRFHAYLLATTWSPSIESWWRGGMVGFPGSATSPKWRQLADALDGCATHTFQVADHGDSTQWLLLAGGLLP